MGARTQQDSGCPPGKGGPGSGATSTLAPHTDRPSGPGVSGEAGLEDVGAGAEPHLSQALCPGDKVPLHKDLPGELVVRELFSSVLQEISDEVSEGGQDGVGG